MNKLVKLEKLLKVGAPLSVRFMLSIMDDAWLPDNIKKNAILYYKGDKRLSVSKFLDTISKTKAKINLQKGGGWKIQQHNLHGYRLDVYGPQEPDVTNEPATPSPTNFNFGVIVSSQTPSPSATSPQSSPKLGVLIGSGSFASVFAITEDKQHVVKIFFKAHTSVFDAIRENIGLFKDKHKADATVFPSDDIFDIESIIDREEYSNFGYKMLKCDKSLKDALTDAHINTAVAKLKNKSYVHGDIKLDNIMLKDDELHISDWDGVYLHTLAADFPKPLPKSVCFSPATVHPYYLCYVAMFKGKDIIFANFPDSTLIDRIWNMFLNDSSIGTMIKNIVNDLYNDNFAKHAELYKSNGDWHKHMLERCDQYSLGMSLLLWAKQEENKDYMSKGAEILANACKKFVPTSEGGAENLNMARWDLPTTMINTTAMNDKTKAIDSPSPPLTENKLSAKDNILATLNKAKLLKDNKELKALMQTRMFVPDEYVAAVTSAT